MARINIDYSRCTGCRLCELACSLQHIENAVNPKRSRIRVFVEGHIHFPVLAGPYTDAECNTKVYVDIDGHKYDGCLFCRASCPEKPIFMEPGLEIPLKCDFCGDPPDPQCVKVCAQEALTFVEDD
jgi:Fe-S-cluster-containing hydrogenase component 2